MSRITPGLIREPEILETAIRDSLRRVRTASSLVNRDMISEALRELDDIAETLIRSLAQTDPAPDSCNFCGERSGIRLVYVRETAGLEPVCAACRPLARGA